MNRTDDCTFQDSIVQLNYQPCIVIAIAIMNLVATHPKSTMSSDVLSPESTNLNFDRLNPLRSARALQPVLQLLRSHYPSGCLTAELVQVIQDQFVVQAKVQVEGVAIVSALASASTVEVAEDRARTRALESLGLSSTPSLSHALSSTLSATMSLMPEVVLPEAVLPEVVIEEPIVEVPIVEVPIVEVPIVEVPIVEEPKVTKTSTKRKLKAAAPTIDDEPVLEMALEITPESVVAEPEIAEPEIAVAEIAVAEIAVAEEPQEETFEVTFEGDVEYEYTFEEDVSVEVVPIASPVMVPVAVIPDFTMDLADAIAQIGSEIDRIGWTKKQGSGYLQETYGKRTRAELTEAELFGFLSYLKSLPAKVQPDLSALPF
jgi:hypothetical protein